MTKVGQISVQINWFLVRIFLKQGLSYEGKKGSYFAKQQLYFKRETKLENMFNHAVNTQGCDPRLGKLLANNLD